jgi:hypothetical protein
MVHALSVASPIRAGQPRPAETAAFALWAGVIGYITLLAGGRALLNDPDTLWHVAAGRWIRAHQAVPNTDVFSYTMAGAPWTAHEWLSEAALAAIYDQFGWTGVVILAALAGGAAVALLAFGLSRYLAPRFAAIIAAFSLLLAASHMTARPHLLAMPLMVAWVMGLVQARTEERAPSFWLVAALWLWANLHGGFVIGLGLAALLAVEAAWSAPARKRAGEIRRWAAFLAASAIVSLCTPQGTEGWIFPFRLMAMRDALSFVTEWHAPDYARLQPVEFWLAGLVALLAVLRPRIPPIRALLVAVLVYMALTPRRNAELLALIAPLLLAPSIGERLEREPAAIPPLRGFAVLAAAALAIVATVAANLRGYAPDSRDMPVRALAAARAAHLDGPVFNAYDFGGFLIFSGVPVFIDGRVDLYGGAFTKTYMTALSDRGGALPKLLDHYRVQWTLLAPQSPAANALDRMPGWTRIYADSIAVVHRRVQANESP